MKQATPTLEYFGVYKDSFRSHVHAILEWGYTDAMPMIQAKEQRHHEETSITGFIVDAIRRRFRTHNRPKWLKHYAVYEDYQVESEERVGRTRYKVDIVIEGATISQRPQYMFEAKRLKSGACEANRYLGSDGIGCFINGRYADRYAEAAMLGYVQSDSLEHWKTKISNQIENRGTALFLKALDSNVQFEHSLPLEWASEHHRVTLGRPIRILHILLDCRQPLF